MWGQCLAGIVLGLPLAVLLTGLVAYSWPGPWQAVLAPTFLLFFPIWVGAMAASYMAKNGKRAWLWLAGLNLGAFVLLWALKHFGWVS